MAAVIIGLMVLVALLIAKMPYAGLFAVLSFAGEMIPLVGLLLSSIPAIIVAGVLIGVDYAVIITLIFFIIAQIENYIVYPKIMSNRVGVPSLVVLLSILIGLKLLGF
ncbi:MAG: AI-2E family transporter [Cyanobium sp. MAG06]|nr:AI-2E family transporter [Cyanobium sp. MAG06]